MYVVLLDIFTVYETVKIDKTVVGDCGKTKFIATAVLLPLKWLL